MDPTEPTEKLPEPPKEKPKRTRQMTPELLEKLKLARERAKELRDIARKEKENLKDDDLPEPEKTKVAKYLATRKIIKERMEKDIKDEIKNEIVVEQEKPKKVQKKPVVESDESDDEYTVIKVPKRKIVKWEKKKNLNLPPPQPEKSVYGSEWVNPYGTQHLINLSRAGYRF